MRIAIVHDISIVFGGSERVLIALLRMYPHADVYVGFISETMRQVLRRHTDGVIIASPYNHAPLATRYPDIYKPLLLLWWKSLDLSQYDLVIASSHSYSSKSVNPPREVPYVAYIHTPPRYLWGIYNESQWIHRWPYERMLSPILRWMKHMDTQSAKRPDALIANSRVVQKRIRKFYHRESVIVYPPIQLPTRILPRTPRYYLCVSRLVKQKGVDVAIAACNALAAPLVIVGVGKEEAALRRIAGPTVRFRGFVPDKQMPKVYAGAKALLYFSREEDFGLSAVEAMAHGVPVIASQDGGAQETVVHGKTGVLLPDITVQKVITTLERFDYRRFSSHDCRKQAKLFSEDTFHRKMRSVISFVLKTT